MLSGYNVSHEKAPWTAYVDKMLTLSRKGLARNNMQACLKFLLQNVIEIRFHSKCTHIEDISNVFVEENLASLKLSGPCGVFGNIKNKIALRLSWYITTVDAFSINLTIHHFNLIFSQIDCALEHIIIENSKFCGQRPPWYMLIERYSTSVWYRHSNTNKLWGKGVFIAQFHAISIQFNANFGTYESNLTAIDSSLHKQIKFVVQEQLHTLLLRNSIIYEFQLTSAFKYYAMEITIQSIYQECKNCHHVTIYEGPGDRSPMVYSGMINVMGLVKRVIHVPHCFLRFVFKDIQRFTLGNFTLQMEAKAEPKHPVTNIILSKENPFQILSFPSSNYHQSINHVFHTWHVHTSPQLYLQLNISQFTYLGAETYNCLYGGLYFLDLQYDMQKKNQEVRGHPIISNCYETYIRTGRMSDPIYTYPIKSFQSIGNAVVVVLLAYSGYSTTSTLQLRLNVSVSKCQGIVAPCSKAELDLVYNSFLTFYPNRADFSARHRHFITFVCGLQDNVKFNHLFKYVYEVGNVLFCVSESKLQKYFFIAIKRIAGNKCSVIQHLSNNQAASNVICHVVIVNPLSLLSTQSTLTSVSMEESLECTFVGLEAMLSVYKDNYFDYLGYKYLRGFTVYEHREAARITYTYVPTKCMNIIIHAESSCARDTIYHLRDSVLDLDKISTQIQQKDIQRVPYSLCQMHEFTAKANGVFIPFSYKSDFSNYNFAYISQMDKYLQNISQMLVSIGVSHNCSNSSNISMLIYHQPWKKNKVYIERFDLSERTASTIKFANIISENITFVIVSTQFNTNSSSRVCLFQFTINQERLAPQNIYNLLHTIPFNFSSHLTSNVQRVILVEWAPRRSSWNEANNYCKTFGALLYSPHTEEMFNYIYNILMGTANNQPIFNHCRSTSYICAIFIGKPYIRKEVSN